MPPGPASSVTTGSSFNFPTHRCSLHFVGQPSSLESGPLSSKPFQLAGNGCTRYWRNSYSGSLFINKLTTASLVAGTWRLVVSPDFRIWTSQLSLAPEYLVVSTVVFPLG
ncbi:hypothetical protein J3459_014864 [Metarhizium acridum]|nr:hypothetical protein J3459_014864 [Metarhizium acridum]